VLPWLITVAALAVACVAYGILVERRWYRWVHRRIPILPTTEAPELTVLHLSDLHLTRRSATMRRFLSGLPACHVCVVTGDIVGEPEAVEDAVEALRHLRGTLASFFVLGSNDYYVARPLNYVRYFRKRRRHRPARRGRAPDLVARLEADGWVHLKNRRRSLSLDGLEVEVVGLDDPHIGRQDLRVAPREHPDAFGLAVVHSPDPAPELAALGYDLMVFGHTHGGQVRFPLIGALVTNSDVPRRIASGLVRMGKAYAHISPGLGTSKYAPFRFLCRPEATVLELVPRAATRGRPSSPAGRARRTPAP
jgi:predicted MPP superfamily phosphohydrolase